MNTNITNDQEWLSSNFLGAMLECIRTRSSPRKLRLFAVACCRQVLHLLNECSQAALETIEEEADTGTGTDSYPGAWIDAQQGFEAARHSHPDQPPGEPEARINAAWAVVEAAHVVADDDGEIIVGKSDYEAACQCSREILTDPIGEALKVRLLRCLVGNPFRPVPPVDSAWLTWRQGTIPRLAQTIDAERAFDRMPILADALEDAGCTDADILAHCRQPGPHTRGCWVLDLVRSVG
jgi:hypothetical protein